MVKKKKGTIQRRQKSFDFGLALICLGLLFVGVFVGSKLWGTTVTPAPPVTGSSVYMQDAESATITQDEKNSRNYTLILANITPRTVQIKAGKAVGTMDVKVFLDKGWDFATGRSRSEHVPHATLLTHNSTTGSEEALLLELTNPQYDEINNVLSYTVSFLSAAQDNVLRPLNDTDFSDFPKKITYPLLFISDMSL